MGSAGRPFLEVAQAGGGIVSTVKSTRAASPSKLEAAAAERLGRWFDGGATTVEAKTGYHLTRQGELGAGRNLRRLSERTHLPRAEVTVRPAHAAPPEAGAPPAPYAPEPRA